MSKKKSKIKETEIDESQGELSASAAFFKKRGSRKKQTETTEEDLGEVIRRELEVTEAVGELSFLEEGAEDSLQARANSEMGDDIEGAGGVEGLKSAADIESAGDIEGSGDVDGAEDIGDSEDSESLLNIEGSGENESLHASESESLQESESPQGRESQAGQDSDVHSDFSDDGMDLSGTELENFEAADLGDTERLPKEKIRSITESILFATDKPISIAVIKQSFKGTDVRSKDIREALQDLQREYNESVRGFTLDEVGGGFQLRTKPENMTYLRQSVKARPFKVSGPALEVLSIVAYKQPTTKAQIDEIRGVESGHLLRALMEKGLLTFGERSDLPGKPMFYETTRKFLEIFGLRNLHELPSLHEIDQLIPEGIGEPEKKETLGDLTEKLSEEVAGTYSVGEEELLKITDELSQITTSSEFFEQEKQRMREKRDQERARDIREALTVGEKVEDKDLKWLERYEKGLLEAAQAEKEVAFVTEGGSGEGGSGEESPEESDLIDLGDGESQLRADLAASDSEDEIERDVDAGFDGDKDVLL